MEIITRDRPAFANLHVKMNAGDRITAEADAMASMSTTLTIKTRWNGGFFGAVLRRIFGGETLFINEFIANAPGELVLTQPFPGDIECMELNGTSLFLQPGAYLASESGVKLGVQWAGFTSWIGGEGLFRLKVSGTGKVWFGAYGGIFAKEIDGPFVVDTGHLVAYEPTVGMKVGLAGGIFSSFFSKEGLVSRVTGPGRIYLQSRSIDGLATWTNRHLWR
jgi:uncharacterized protein (TIGR00266 family)